MEVRIACPNCVLSGDQRDWIESKMKKLANMEARLNDESTVFEVQVHHEGERNPNEAFSCHVSIFAPQKTIRANASGSKMEIAMDEVTEALRKQIEKYKGKTHHLNDRGE